MAVTKTIEGTCAQCGYSGDHDIVAMHADGVGFCFGMECPSCGKLVPEIAWIRYLKTGDVVVPSMKGKLFKANNHQVYQKATRHLV